MQKKILAVAVAGALASPLALAQSSVTIYGAFDLSVHSYRISSGTASVSNSKWDLYNQSSRIGFRGEENLGGGLRAWFQGENGFSADGRRTDAGAFAFGSRNTGAGLTGGWGTIMAGMWDSPYKVSIGGITGMAVAGGLPGHNGPAIGNGDTTGTNPNANCVGAAAAGTQVLVSTVICQQFEGGATQFHRRLANVVQYWSPKFGGFDFRAAMTMNEEKGRSGAATSGFENNPRLWSLSGTYAAGPWFATIAYDAHRGYRDTAAAQNVKDKGWIVGGGFNFGVAAVNAGYERLKYGNAGAAGAENGFTRPSWFVGASAPLGPAGSALRAGYSRMSKFKSCGTAADCSSNQGIRVFTIGYEYALSKRTAPYIQYGKVTNSSAATSNFNSAPYGANGATSAIGAGQDITTLGVGLKHTF